LEIAISYYFLFVRCRKFDAYDLTRDLTGFIYADKGYIKQNLFINLYERGLKMVHGIKKNMPNKLMDLNEKILLRKRNIIETVFDYLKKTDS
jgi:hypothetical protein